MGNKCNVVSGCNADTTTVLASLWKEVKTCDSCRLRVHPACGAVLFAVLTSMERQADTTVIWQLRWTSFTKTSHVTRANWSRQSWNRGRWDREQGPILQTQRFSTSFEWFNVRVAIFTWQVCVVYSFEKRSWCRAQVEAVSVDSKSYRAYCFLVDHAERVFVSSDE